MDKKINYPNMVIKKSEGVSRSERYLLRKCQSTFLSLWNYPNPYKDQKKGKELCDVLAIFENHIFIFSDKYCKFSEEADVHIAWNRWYKHAIENSAKQIAGAERWLRQGKALYLDAKLTQPFPLDLKLDENTRIHRIVVARGAKHACQKYFGGGSGSLAVDTTIEGSQHVYGIDMSGEEVNNNLFRVGIILDREKYVHVFDDFTLDCVMDELDTVSDFIDYLDEKERLIATGKQILSSGEEDILAFYLSTIENDKHCCATSEVYKSEAAILHYEEAWLKYIASEGYSIKKNSNESSYLWDRLLNNASNSMMNGTLRDMSHDNYESQLMLFTHFAKPCRVYRRALANSLIESMQLAVEKIGTNSHEIRSFMRRVKMDDNPDTMVHILWLHKPASYALETFLTIRRRILEAKMLVLLSKHPNIIHHIGIGKTLEINDDDTEDFVYMKASDFLPDCESVRNAEELLSSQSEMLERYAKTVSSQEYEEGDKQETIPYPW